MYLEVMPSLLSHHGWIFLEIIKCCEQNFDRVSKNDTRYHFCSILGFNAVLLKVGKIWDSVYVVTALAFEFLNFVN